MNSIFMNNMLKGIKPIHGIILLIQIILLCAAIWQTSDKKTRFRNIDKSIPQTVLKNSLIEGVFRARVSLPLNEHTIVRYCIPIDSETGNPPESASKIIFYAPYNADAHNIAHQLPAWVRDFSETYGYTVFSLTIETSITMANDKRNYYIESSAGWFEVIFAVQKKIQSLYGLKEKKLVIVGQSSGGSMAQKMLATYPDRISCAAWCGGRLYTPFNSHSDARVLALNLWGCPGLEQTKTLMTSANEHNIDFQRYVVPPPPLPNVTKRMFHHAAWQLPFDMIKAFVINHTFEDYTTQLPKEDYGEQDFEICQIPPSPKRMIVFLWKDSDRVILKDLLWYSYNMGFIPAYLFCPNIGEEKMKHCLKEINKMVRKHNVQISFLAKREPFIEALAQKYNLPVQYSDSPHNLIIKLNRGK